MIFGYDPDNDKLQKCNLKKYIFKILIFVHDPDNKKNFEYNYQRKQQYKILIFDQDADIDFF